MNYKEQQRANDAAYRNRGQVLHVSCVIAPDEYGILRKYMIGGTYLAGAKKRPRLTKAERKEQRWSNLLAAFDAGKATFRTVQ